MSPFDTWSARSAVSTDPIIVCLPNARCLHTQRSPIAAQNAASKPRTISVLDVVGHFAAYLVEPQRSVAGNLVDGVVPLVEIGVWYGISPLV